MKKFIILASMTMFCLGTISESWAVCNNGIDEDGDNCGSWDCGQIVGKVNCTLSKGVFTISGEGKMKDYGWHHTNNDNEYPKIYVGNTPWAGKGIESVVVGNGVTRIGKHAFIGESRLTKVSGMENIKEIGEGSLEATSISSIDLPNVERIEIYAFHLADKLQFIGLPESTDFTLLTDNTFAGTKIPYCGKSNRSACGNCDDGYIVKGQGCIECKGGQVFWNNECYDEYPFAKKRWTPAEANEWLHDGNDNFVVITFKK